MRKHDYIGIQWRFDRERSAAYFPACSCGAYTERALGTMRAAEIGPQWHAEHVTEVTQDAT